MQQRALAQVAVVISEKKRKDLLQSFLGGFLLFLFRDAFIFLANAALLCKITA